jgi:hypothetical protein
LLHEEEDQWSGTIGLLLAPCGILFAFAQGGILSLAITLCILGCWWKLGCLLWLSVVVVPHRQCYPKQPKRAV